MSRLSRLLPPVMLLVGIATCASDTARSATPRGVSLAERITAQEAIERVYYGHQLDARRAFEQAVPRALLERKVRDALAKSVLLERRWNVEIGDAALQQELQRIAADTRLPERLREIYDALGHDPRLVKEAFVRPVLVDRLARRRFASDAAAGKVASVAWDEWWGANRKSFEGIEPRGQAAAAGLLPAPLARAKGDGREAAIASNPESSSTEAASCFTDDSWDAGRFGMDPNPRLAHTALWTGSLMLVWGGFDGADLLDDGARYDPVTDTWTPITRIGAPAARMENVAVWIGSRMIVWGGGHIQTGPHFQDGGMYDPATDTWTPTALTGAPSARSLASAVWTGSRMIVWGGYDYLTGRKGDGGSFDPSTNTWSAIASVGVPSARSGHSAVWTGTEMIVWGGSAAASGDNSGARYNPALDTWTPTSTAGAPAARGSHAAVWTGSRMIVWGGRSGGFVSNAGGVYDPGSDSWTSTTLSGAPTPRVWAVAVWSGTEMIVWGGQNAANKGLDTGGRYNPGTNSWIPTTLTEAPSARTYHTVVWTESEMIAFGGQEFVNGDFYQWSVSTGGRYDPATDSWTPLNADNPRARMNATGIWTGNLLVIWGGTEDRFGVIPFAYLGEGARYDPLVDQWTPTATVGAPAGRRLHTAVWTGSEMIVWGGERLDSYLDSGGRYDPVADSWLPTWTAGAPTGREAHTAVWTGTEMIMWGGSDGVATLGTGGRYDPALDLWLSVPTSGAPLAREFHSAAWTGSAMIVWGGWDGASYLGDGARYTPAAGTWTPTSVLGAPTARAHHAGLWTGTEMTVWGGWDANVAFNTGARYYPATDTWLPTTVAGSPGGGGQQAVWTGSEMFVWPPGGRYNPVADAWAPVSTLGEPIDRLNFIFVWADDFAAIWGGERRGTVGNGSRYFMGGFADLDDDGAACDADCDDTDPASHPGASEICDGRDNDCDTTLPPGEGDGDLDGAPACGDCDDANDDRFPGNPEVCDGLDNNCDTVADGDEDGDTFAVCVECDDSDATRYPLAPEVNDATDDQCPGNPGAGLRDEISGLSGFPSAGDPTSFCWPAQTGATRYEVLRSSDRAFSACASIGTPTSCGVDLGTPASKSVFYYLVRATAPNRGSLGASSAGVERDPFCGGELVCDDGADDDADGLLDCADPDCFAAAGCGSTSVGFTDTAGDDAAATLLNSFFGKIAALPSDYLGVFLTGGPTEVFAICAERADFYRDAYLALAPTDGTAVSGSWNKWTREGAAAWSPPVTTGQNNWFGDSCTGAWSWCPEAGLGGHTLGIAPGEPSICELFDDIECSDGTWGMTVRIGVDRLAACGF